LKTIILSALGLLVVGAQPTFAADIPARAPAQAPLYQTIAPASNWTGCYVGANIGYGRGRDSVVSAGFDEGEPKFDGWLGGGQLGCDYQFSAVVAGIEGMYDFADLNGSTTDPSNTLATTSTKYDRLASTTVRLGYAFDRSLFYVKGGIAWERSERSIVGPGFTQFTGDQTKQGTVLGVGWEYLFAPNWSAKIEYNHFHFGALDESIVQQPGGAVFRQEDSNKKLETVMLGLNYRFRPF
jgi:outer membrane immunogenic protein